MKDKLKQLQILSWTGYGLFFAGGLLVFFIGAFLVVLLRTKNTVRVIMPDLIGKNYTEVHNELMRLRFKVKLENKRYPEKNDGMILTQSISPGKSVEAGSKLYLSINTGVDAVQIPDLRGQTITNAKSLLEKVLSGETYVNIQIGGITYIDPVQGQNPETVIEQIPEPGKVTTTREKIYLLVTEPKGRSKKDPDPTSMKGQPFPLVMQKFNQEQKKWRIREIVPVKFRHETGYIESAEKNSMGGWDFRVKYYDASERYESGYEKVSYKLRKDGVYSMILENPDKKESGKTLFTAEKYEKDELVQLILYREGKIKLTLVNDADKEEVKTFTLKSTL